MLLHVADLSEPNVLENLEVVRAEFRAYGADLEGRPCLVIGNKTDLPGTEENARLLKDEMERRGVPCLMVSALKGEGIPELIREIVALVRANLRPVGVTTLAEEPEVYELPRRRGGTPTPVEIQRLADGRFRVAHENLEKSVGRINFDHEDAILKFSRLLKRFSVEEALEAAGALEGDMVLIGEEEFEFQPDRIME